MNTRQCTDVNEITRLQSSRTDTWHNSVPAVSESEFFGLVEQNHLENFLLWHEEDIARRDDIGPDRVVLAKRRIDGHNQRRNDIVERLDQFITAELKPEVDECPFNSETPGMMIDRLSILALKSYHMTEEAQRTDASDEHRRRCATKVQVIHRQIGDLSLALHELLQQIQQGTRSFRVYFQFKMYNDKELNPQLRRAA